MFRIILLTQWKWSRLALGIVTLVVFALPLLTVQYASQAGVTQWDSRELLNAVQSWSAWYPFLALTAGLLLAMTAWGNDHRGHHVYALSLPVPRWQYALLRYGAGAALLALPVVVLWIGALLATSTATIPPGLHAYPNALAFRFLIAAVLAYSIFFSISAGSARTAGYVLGVVAGLFLIQFLLTLADSRVNILQAIFDRLLIWPGPLEPFTGRWMLIDV
jgi:hypothetical protein